MWLKCPESNHKFAELSEQELDIANFLTTPYIEFSCQSCRWYMRKSDSTILQVWHKFDLNGELIETSVHRTDTGSRSVRRTTSGAG